MVQDQAPEFEAVNDVGNPLPVTDSQLTSAGTLLDAFGRLRVSSPETVFDATFRYDKRPLLFSELTATGGTATHDANRVSVGLAVTGSTGSSVKFQSRRYFKYHPAKSHLVVVSFNLNSSDAVSLVRRTKTSGSVVDNSTAQSSWNIDPMNGSGPSGITLDFTKQQILAIDFQWLGSGRIRYGFFINGKLYYCHQELSANSLSVPWSQTADLPIRAQCDKTASTVDKKIGYFDDNNGLFIAQSGSTNSTLYLTCCSVICENFWTPEGIVRTAGSESGDYSLSGTGLVPVCSLRKQSSYVTLPVRILDIQSYINSTDDIFVKIIKNGSLTGASWSALSGYCEVDNSATAISGGDSIYSFYVRGSAQNQSFLADIFRDAVNAELGSDLSGNSEIISVVCQNITDSSAKIRTAINYKELV